MSFISSHGDKPAYDLSELSVLVVDENRHMLLLIKEILRAFHVRTTQTATDGADALKVLKTFSPDLIITDSRMRPLDGLEMVEMIRTSSDSFNPYVPIIMLTGYTEHHRVIEAMNAGINEFLAKPVSARSLYARIAAVIERPRKFIRCKTYTGPDRRRRSMEAANYTGNLRREEDQRTGSASAKPANDLSQSNVDALFA